MKSYSEEIIINSPLEVVSDLFAAIEHYPEWQPDLKDYQTFSGLPLQDGAKTRMVYREGKHDDVKMVETIIENKLPHFIKIKYSTDGVISYQTHSFEALNATSAKYRVDTEYDLDGLMKVLSIFTPNHFKNQTRDFMEAFKIFAENKTQGAITGSTPAHD